MFVKFGIWVVKCVIRNCYGIVRFYLVFFINLCFIMVCYVIWWYICVIWKIVVVVKVNVFLFMVVEYVDNVDECIIWIG